MAMTLRLTAAETAALRRRAGVEGASMQDVVRRAIEEYIQAHEPEAPIGAVIDEQRARFAGAVAQLGRWQD
jgi:ribbon-helix-helix CopG family protein